MSKALLICNGENDSALLKRLAREADFILTADAGADAALQAGVMPDAVIGDLDSVSPACRRALNNTPFIHITRQDNTDFAKAMLWLARKKYASCAVAGAAGKRMDFTIGNILAAFTFAKKMSVIFYGKGWRMLPLVHGGKFTARAGARLSLIPFTACRGITLKGLKFPLKNASWKAGQTTGTSNEVLSENFEILFTSGKMLMYVED